MTSDEMREKIFQEVLDYATVYGYERKLANSEALFQCDNMQIDALNLVGDLLNILNGES